MWDALIMGDDGKPEYVVEIKTVQVDGRSGSLADRWKDGEAPHYQALQASLYAYLLGIDKVLMVAVALEDKKGDYEHPEQVVPSYANSNVYIDEFRVSKRYPNFSLLIEQAIGWWEMYVLTGVSPEYDSKLDKDIISALKTNFVDASADIQSLINEVEQLKNEIDSILTLKGVNAKQKRVDELTKLIKQYAMEQFRPNDNTVSFIGKTYNWVMTKSDTVELDKESLKRDGLYDKYLIPKTNYRLTPSKIKEDK